MKKLKKTIAHHEKNVKEKEFYDKFIERNKELTQFQKDKMKTEQMKYKETLELACKIKEIQSHYGDYYYHTNKDKQFFKGGYLASSLPGNKSTMHIH
jgi:hypothetical protein